MNKTQVMDSFRLLPVTEAVDYGMDVWQHLCSEEAKEFYLRSAILLNVVVLAMLEILVVGSQWLIGLALLAFQKMRKPKTKAVAMLPCYRMTEEDAIALYAEVDDSSVSVVDLINVEVVLDIEEAVISNEDKGLDWILKSIRGIEERRIAEEERAQQEFRRVRKRLTACA